MPINILSNRVFSAVVFFLISLVLYSLNLERAAHPDEFYHMLAARGLLETGEPTIGPTGQYWRGFPLTWLVAQSLDLFGDSLSAGRLPSVIMMAVLVVLLFLFLHREAGALAAWIGAGLFAVSPFAVGIAQLVRFYSVQCLLFFAAAWLIYSMLQSPFRAKRIVPLGILAFFLLVAAVYFQPTTYFGIVGLALWSAGVVALPWLLDCRVPRTHKRWAVSGVVIVVLLTVTGLWFSGIFTILWQNYYRATALFLDYKADHFWYYHAWYVLFYPTLWTLSGLLSVLALIKSPRATLFLLTVFMVGFILSSFAGPKNERYIAYAHPFLFGLWGIGLAALWTIMGDAINHLKEQLAGTGFSILPSPLAGRAAATMLVLAVIFTVLTNPAWLRTVTVIADISVPPELPTTRWDAAAPELTPWLEQVEVVVTTDDLGMLYFYGRADYLLDSSKFEELPAGKRQPFGRDIRTSVPVINDAASLEAIIDCHASGIFIVESSRWIDGARPYDDAVAVAEMILARTERLELTPNSHLAAFVWDGTASPDCAVPPDSRPTGQ
jgi:hypothetical protein